MDPPVPIEFKFIFVKKLTKSYICLSRWWSQSTLEVSTVFTTEKKKTTTLGYMCMSDIAENLGVKELKKQIF